MEQYVVIHMDKRREISPVLERHIFRMEVRYVDGVRTETVWVPDNADPEKSNLNEELVSMKSETPEGKEITLTINQAIRKRLNEAGIKKVRKDQNTAIEIILTGSPETMNNLSEEDLKKWVEESMEWAGKQWGKDNIVSAVLHRDEKTPHIHIILVPLVTGQSRRTASKEKKLAQQGISKKKYNINNERLRLSANEVYTQPRLYGYHTSYAKEVGEKYGLQRGVRAEAGSRKKHQTSEDYNRELEREKLKKQELINTLTSDYSEKEKNLEQINADIEIAQNALNIADQDRITAEARKDQAEIDAATKEAQVKELETKSSSLSGEISDKATELANLETKVQEQQGQVDKNKDIISEQATTIESNKKTIKDQEKTISSRKEVDEDALDKRINEKVFTVNRLEAEITTTQRKLFNAQQELKIEDAKVKQLRAELKSKVNLEKVPTDGPFGYKSSEVKAFIQSVALASLQEEMNKTATPVDVNEDLRTEIENLRSVQDRYNELINSPELLQQQIQYLEQEKKRESIKNTIEYVTQKKVQILSFSVENSSRGEEIYTNFRFENDEIIRKGVIKANERLIYTAKDYVNSYQTANEHLQDKIWTVYNPVTEIRQKRHDQEILSRYNIKLSNKFRTNVGLVSFEESGALKCFSSFNGTSYIVDKDNVVWTTSDKRIKVAKDCIKYLDECNWKDEGDINTLKMSTGTKQKKK